MTSHDLRHERMRVSNSRSVDDIPMVGEFVQFTCAFCGQDTSDDPRYAHLSVDWPHSGESQSLGAHTACLRAAVRTSIPLAVE